LSQEERRTTSGAIAVANLDGEIADLERILATHPGSVVEMSALTDALIMRGEYLGRLADYDRAAELADGVMRAAPADGRAYLLRARMRSTFHHFTEALADLAEAQRHGVGAERIDAARADILQALGQLDEPLLLRRRIAAERPDIITLGAEALLRGRRGDVAGADHLFIAAQYAYRDVSPFPFAWLYCRHGEMWERAGDVVHAKELYEAALARLPSYALAAGHLATLEADAGRYERAIEVLRPLLVTADDPEYTGQLIVLLRQTGQNDEADRLRTQAKQRFDTLAELHPEAFAAKAARFWLGPGGDAQKALRLARLNLQARQTSDAFELAAEASLAAGEASSATR